MVDSEEEHDGQSHLRDESSGLEKGLNCWKGKVSVVREMMFDDDGREGGGGG